METATQSPEQQQAQPISAEEFKNLNDASMSAEELADTMHRLEDLDDKDKHDLAKPLSTVATRIAQEAQDWRTLDSLTADLRRLGLVGVDARYADPALDGPELKPKALPNPDNPNSPHMEMFGKEALVAMRQRRPQMIEAEFDGQLRQAIQVNGVSPILDERKGPLARAAARALMEGQLEGKLVTDKGKVVGFEAKPTTEARAKLQAAEKFGKEVFKDPKAFWSEVDKTRQAIEAESAEMKARLDAVEQEHTARQAEAARLKVEQEASEPQRQQILSLQEEMNSELDRRVADRTRVLNRRANDETLDVGSKAAYRELLEPDEMEKFRQSERQKIVDAAREEALSSDRETRKVFEVSEQWQKRIDAATDQGLKAQLTAERDAAIQNARQEMREVNQQAAKLSLEAEKNQHLDSDLVHIQAKDRHAADRAAANKEALGVQSEPFLVVNKGGLFHLSREKRGPRVREEYFRSPDNPHLIVLERRAQKNGELISHSVFTSERPTRDLGHNRIRPPKNFNFRLKSVRDHDLITSGYQPTGLDYLPGYGGSFIGRNESRGRAKRPRSNGGWLYWLLGERT